MKRKAIFIIGIISLILMTGNVKATEERISGEKLEESQNFVVEEIKTREEAVMLLSTEEVAVVETWDISATEEDNVIASFYSDGTLIISGTGRMKVNNGSGEYPWQKENIKIKKAIIDGGVKEIGDWLFYNENQLEKVVILDGVESIGYDILGGNCKLTDIYIPESIINISGSSLKGLKLLNIKVDKDNKNYSDIDGVLFNKDCTNLICYPIGKNETEYVIPEGVSNICEKAFLDCINLENIIIPDSITELERYSFEDCIGLTEVVLPNSITTIGEYAFQRCINLENINIPEEVSKIHALVFAQTKISKVTISKNVEEIHFWAFADMQNLKEIQVDEENEKYSSKEGILFNKDYTELICYPGGKIEKQYIIPENIHTIGREAFNSQPALEKIIIPNTVNEISSGAFSGCENLTTIQIPNTISEISSSLFSYCTNLKNIEIPDSITRIKSYAFSNCTSLTSIKIPKNVNYIGVDAFKYCNQLNKIEVYCGSYSEEHVKENYNDKLEIIHTEIIDAAVAPRCTETGLTEGKHCSVCNKILIAQEEIPSSGHNFGDWTVTKEVTCVEDGLKEKVCSVCKDKQTETIYSLGHSYGDFVVDIEPTCTEVGEKSKHCMRCNDSRNEITTIDSLGHNFGAWVIDKEATYEEEGHKYRICTNCNIEKEEQVIPVLTKEELQVTTIYTVKEQDNVKYVMSTVNTSVSQILSNITANKEIKVVDKTGKELGVNDLVGTGAKVVTKEDNKEIYTVVVKGDVNGDALVKPIDVTVANRIRLNKVKFGIAELLAADINENGKVDPVEVTMINRYRLGKIKI